MTTSNRNRCARVLSGLALLAGLAVTTASVQAAATIVIQNTNAAGVGFNDATPAAPIGGNAGTTLGEQRLIAFQAAANIWGATLTSSQTITIRASFTPLSCTANSAVLGSAGAFNIWSDFPGAQKPATWYPQALANKLTGANLSADDPVTGQDIIARFNSRLGLFPDCLPGAPFYLGLDNNHGTAIDLVTVLLHEFGHGLGFQTFTSGLTGAPFFGLPAIWDHFLVDDTTTKLWVNMTDAERAASALKPRQLSWAGANVSTKLPGVLSIGTPRLQIDRAGAASGDYLVGTASFGPPLGREAVRGKLVLLSGQPDGTSLACNPLVAPPKKDDDGQDDDKDEADDKDGKFLKGKIVLVDRGTCGFVVKAQNVQAAGARGMIVADNVAGSPPPGLGGTDPTITIPAIRITLDDGKKLKAALAQVKSSKRITASLGVNTSQYAGANPLGRALMYTPNPYQSGSSVSHWDTIASPNQLMEPAINGDLQHSVVTPADLTFELLKDIGW
jgi:PA domain